MFFLKSTSVCCSYFSMWKTFLCDKVGESGRKCILLHLN